MDPVLIGQVALCKDGSQALGSCHAGFCTQACLRLHFGRKLSDLQTVREQHGEGLAVFMGLGFESPLVKTLGDVSVWSSLGDFMEAGQKIGGKFQALGPRHPSTHPNPPGTYYIGP